MKKLLSLLAFFWVFTTCLPAQQNIDAVGLIGSMVDPTGQPLNGHMTLALTLAGVRNTCVTPYQNVPRGPVSFNIVNGTIVNGSSASLIVQDCMSPRSAYYVSVYDQSNKLLFAANWYFHSQAINNMIRAQDVGQLVSTQFSGPIAVAISQGVVTNPTGDQTITEPAGHNLIINSAICTGTCVGFGGGGGGGGVTSVGITMPTTFNVTVSPITSSGNLVVTWSTETANTVLAGPCSGSATQPSFRLLCSGDIPNNAANTTGTSSMVTQIVPVSLGGTGVSNPSLVGSGGITISGSWPNQTVTGSSVASGSPTQLAVFGGANILSGDPNITDSGTLITMSTAIYLPVLTASQCLALDASNLLITQACSSGGGGTGSGNEPYLGVFNTSSGPQMNFGGSDGGGYVVLNGPGPITGITVPVGCVGGTIACTYDVLASGSGFSVAFSTTGGPTNNILTTVQPTQFIPGGEIASFTYDPVNGLWHLNQGLVPTANLSGLINAANIATTSLANTTVLYNNYYTGTYNNTFPYTQGEMVVSGGQTFVSLIGPNTGNNPTASPADWAPIGLSCGQTFCPSSSSTSQVATGGQTAGATTMVLGGTGLNNFSPTGGCFSVDAEYECYTFATGATMSGITRGLYGTTAAAHSAGAQLTSAMILGANTQLASTVITGGYAAPVEVGINTEFPNSHASQAVLDINAGTNEIFFTLSGQIIQVSQATSLFAGPINVTQNSFSQQPAIANTGNVLQTSGPNETFQPLGFGGNIAGSVNIVTTPNIPAASLTDLSGGGSSTRTYVCAGVDFDGNNIPGTAVSVTTAAASFSFPSNVTIACPWAAGIQTWNIFRTVGGPNQGLLATFNNVNGPVYADANVTTIGPTTPPVTNQSNPHLSVAGSSHQLCDTSANPDACVVFGTGAPTGCGTTYGIGSVYYNESGTTQPAYNCTSQGWIQGGGAIPDSVQSGWISVGTTGAGVVIGTRVAEYAGHFTTLVISSGGGSCTTAPFFNVFNGATNGTHKQAVTSFQAQGTVTTQDESPVTFNAGDVIGIKIDTIGATCTSSFFVAGQLSYP